MIICFYTLQSLSVIFLLFHFFKFCLLRWSAFSYIYIYARICLCITCDLCLHALALFTLHTCTYMACTCYPNQIFSLLFYSFFDLFSPSHQGLSMMYEMRRLILKERNTLKKDLESARKEIPPCIILLKGIYFHFHFHFHFFSIIVFRHLIHFSSLTTIPSCHFLLLPLYLTPLPSSLFASTYYSPSNYFNPIIFLLSELHNLYLLAPRLSYSLLPSLLS